tara:strand:- start:57 stop:236 length:180 start_codon:yes stop_codon:yes gene_type:complete
MMTKLKRKMIDRVVDIVSNDPVLESLRQKDQDKLEEILSRMPDKMLLATIPVDERQLYI